MAIVGRVKYTRMCLKFRGDAMHLELPSHRISSKFRVRVYFAHPTITFAKIREYSQSTYN